MAQKITRVKWVALLAKHKRLHEKQKRTLQEKGVQCQCIDYCYVRPPVPLHMRTVDGLIKRIAPKMSAACRVLGESWFTSDRELLKEGRKAFAAARLLREEINQELGR